jgi:hypothetical protein
VGVVLSLDAALGYNRTHTRSALKSPGLSGWRPNLAFPPVDVDGLLGRNGVVLACYLVGLAIMAGVVWQAWGKPGATRVAQHAGRPGRAALRTVGWLGAAITAAWLCTSSLGDWTSDRFLLGETDAQMRVIGALMDQARCRICFSSRRAQLDWKQIQPNSATRARGVITERDLHVRLDVIVEGSPDAPAFGRARIDFGDGTAPLSTGVLGMRTVEHQYGGPGTYRVVVSFEDAVGSITSAGYSVTVHGP